MRSTVVAETRRAGWRERWARQQNQRRQRAHAAAMAAWRQQDAEHQRLLELGRSARPAADDGSYAWLGLKRGETIYWAGGARMVETPYAVTLRPPDHRELPPVQPLAAVPAVDTGRAAVTSQRVIFVGRGRREWSYAKLAGLAHSAAGQTLMLVGNRKKISGVVPPQPAGADFRLRLALAMADAAGDRSRLIAQLEQQVEQHRSAMPPAPTPATTDQAPLSAWFSQGGGLAAAIALPVLFLFLCVVGVALAGNDEPAESSLPSAGPASEPSREVAARSPSPSPTPSPSESPVASSPSPEPARAAATERPEPEGDCAAYLDSDDWCVDGAGDYDCKGGTGNGPNYAPRGVEVAVPGVDPFGLDRDDDGEGCEGRAAPERPEPPPPDQGTDPRFGTCAEANAAGYGPYHRGEPEYDWYRDADGDGVVCER